MTLAIILENFEQTIPKRNYGDDGYEDTGIPWKAIYTLGETKKKNKTDIHFVKPGNESKHYETSIIQQTTRRNENRWDTVRKRESTDIIGLFSLNKRESVYYDEEHIYVHLVDKLTSAVIYYI